MTSHSLFRRVTATEWAKTPVSPPLRVHQARSPGPTASAQTHDEHLGVMQEPLTGAGDMPAQGDTGPNHRGSWENVLDRETHIG